MTLTQDELMFRSRALAQSHPFTPQAQSYLNRTVARERADQAAPEIGIWAGMAMTAGYCLRRVEEMDADGVLDAPPALGGSDLDELSTKIAELIRTDGAEGLLLYPEAEVVDALDRMIAGEVERRLSHWEGTIDDNSYEQLESYIAWWTIKGYALRVAEQVKEIEQGGREDH